MKKKINMWKLDRDDDQKIIDIYPDDEDHNYIECWCNPKLQIINGWKIYTHKSKDKREYFEEEAVFNEIIN